MYNYVHIMCECTYEQILYCVQVCGDTVMCACVCRYCNVCMYVQVFMYHI